MNSHPAATGRTEDSTSGPILFHGRRKAPYRLTGNTLRSQLWNLPFCFPLPIPSVSEGGTGRQAYTLPYKACRYPALGIILTNALSFSVGMPSAFSCKNCSISPFFVQWETDRTSFSSQVCRISIMLHILPQNFQIVFDRIYNIIFFLQNI